MVWGAPSSSSAQQSLIRATQVRIYFVELALDSMYCLMIQYGNGHKTVQQWERLTASKEKSTDENRIFYTFNIIRISKMFVLSSTSVVQHNKIWGF